MLSSWASFSSLFKQIMYHQIIRLKSESCSASWWSWDHNLPQNVKFLIQNCPFCEKMPTEVQVNSAGMITYCSWRQPADTTAYNDHIGLHYKCHIIGSYKERQCSYERKPKPKRETICGPHLTVIYWLSFLIVTILARSMLIRRWMEVDWKRPRRSYCCPRAHRSIFDAGRLRVASPWGRR
jgi:hypothetical protein